MPPTAEGAAGPPSSLSFEPLAALLGRYPGASRVLVGYSGGADSHSLVHLLARHRGALGGRELAAVYVDHGLSPRAGAWGRHCGEVCRGLAVGFEAVAVDARPRPGEAPEAAARRERYRALATRLGPGDLLLTAHHRDDQVETMLLQLLRGAGPRGLAAMPAAAPLGAGVHLRPLLAYTRHQIRVYGRSHGLEWIEDDGNRDLRRDRNYLRWEIMPRLELRWPGLGRTLTRSASLCAETSALADELAAGDLAWVATARPDCLDAGRALALAPPRQRALLRLWLRRLGLPGPSARQLDRVLADALVAPRDRMPLVRWPGAEVRRFHGCLYAMAPLAPPARGLDREVVLDAAGAAELAISGIGRLRFRPARGQGLSRDALQGARIAVRLRRGGERMRPRAGGPRRTVKHLFQEAAVPPWERERTPLVYAGDRLAAVPGRWIEAELAAAGDQAGVVCEWSKGGAFGTV